uniref:Rhotekin-2 n=1 Tax=Danio rerio TaxID=7955 RepID=RTKN2_DANRE|nr:RecName: Full=Rhotekin-2; AltName: Full=Pleckstrin homology domain-containing family K member 1; Short=PH domain-containing family K member 1 [Danio rerio]AAH83519.1 Rhotekin 2 [Danio rerio]AAH98873.1 Rhotekin 2 [Danio rerio]
MDPPRDIQHFKRNIASRSTVSSCSSLAMEIKRKKIRESMFFPSEDCDIKEKMEFEMRMRAGAYKLMVASTKKEQVLDASRSLLTCNARIKAYMSEAQKRTGHQDFRRPSDSQGQVPCKGKVAISGLRIPLFWKDSEHFNSKGNTQRVAVFCLMKIGSEIFDTEMVIADSSMTDICFEGVKIFSEVKPDFELTFELYICGLDEEATFANTPKKLARKLRSSFGRSSGRKLCPLLDGGDPDTFLQSNPIPPGARYSLLAYTTLGLEQAEGSFQSHSLIILQNVEASSWLPLYGNLCCQLVAQPDCMTLDMMSGFLSQQQSIEGLQRRCRLYCVLKAGKISCYYSPEEIQAKVEPILIIPINKETRIRVVENDHQRPGSRLNLINPGNGDSASHVFIAESPDVLQEWLDSLWQHIYDQSQWQHTCDKLMEIDVLSPRKPPLFLTKQADSVYNDLSIGSPGKFESLTDIIHNKIEETNGRFLIGQEEETEPPHWAALFEGSRPIVVQKTVLSPGKESNRSITSPDTGSKKKRRAPPPPPDKLPFTSVSTNQEKENCKGPKPRAGRPSLDAKFSAIIQQLQKSHTSTRKNAPLGQIETGQQPEKRAEESDLPEYTKKEYIVDPQPPVPAPRNKLRMSFREKMNPKAW